jgi:hypothetical protein
MSRIILCLVCSGSDYGFGIGYQQLTGFDCTFSPFWNSSVSVPVYMASCWEISFEGVRSGTRFEKQIGVSVSLRGFNRAVEMETLSLVLARRHDNAK